MWCSSSSTAWCPWSFPGDDVWIAAYLVMISFPVTFGVAILRYRLYEIDRIISRTISYLVAVGLLAAVFIGVVTVVGSLLQTESASVSRPWSTGGSTGRVTTQSG